MPRIVHFEIQADDPERAMAFYRDLFEWRFDNYFPDYWGVITGEEGTLGINGGLGRRPGPRPEAGQPANSFICVVEVDDIDAYSERALSLGASATAEKHTIPGVGYSAYFADPEGNTFGLFQDDSSAA